MDDARDPTRDHQPAESAPRDAEAFLPPRPYYMTDEEYRAAQRESARELLEAGWRRLREAVEEGGYPSPDWLADLYAESVPPFAREWARDYLHGRLSREVARAGRPLARPDNLHVPDDVLYFTTGGLPPKKAYAVWWVRQLHARLRAIATRTRQEADDLAASALADLGLSFDPDAKVRMRYIKSHDVWKVRAPKAQTLEQVARALRHINPPQLRVYVEPDTLEKWGHEVPFWYGRVSTAMAMRWDAPAED